MTIAKQRMTMAAILIGIVGFIAAMASYRPIPTDHCETDWRSYSAGAANPISHGQYIDRCHTMDKYLSK